MRERDGRDKISQANALQSWTGSSIDHMSHVQKGEKDITQKMKKNGHKQTKIKSIHDPDP